MNHLKKYVKKINFETNILKNKINQIEKEISALEMKKTLIQDEYIALKSKNFDNIQEVFMQRQYLLELKEKINHIELEKKKRENDLIPLKEILAGKNAEKKAVKKYSDKKEKELIKREIKREIELASEIYNRANM